MYIAVINYDSGNLNSVSKAMLHMAQQLSSSAKVKITNQGKDLLDASHIILPGVGAFDDCAHNLHQSNDIWEKLNIAVLEQAKAFLGICVGEQLMVEQGFEGKGANGLGWIKGNVQKISTNNNALKVPHMGWNDIHLCQQHPVFAGLDGKDMYFTHSWAVTDVPQEHLLASCEYGENITAAIGRDNMVGVQFHPEKSQNTGLQLIKNFLQWDV